jgi:putative membrane protein
MLWVKAFHIVFVASWFAGLFYLPRIFVNLAMVPSDSQAERERLLLMARKLMRFMTLLMWPALALGLCLWLVYDIGGLPPANWMMLKLLAVLLAIGYHHLCAKHLRYFESGCAPERMARVTGSLEPLSATIFEAPMMAAACE